MQSFRGISDLTLDFDNQLNILIGDNGSGKSSILDCIGAFLNYLAEQIKLAKENKTYFDQGYISIFADDDINITEKVEARLEIVINSANILPSHRKIRRCGAERRNANSWFLMSIFILGRE